MTRTDALIAEVVRQLKAQTAAIDGASDLAKLVITVELEHGWKPYPADVQLLCRPPRSAVKSAGRIR